MATADKLVNYISKISRKTYKKNTETKSFKNIFPIKPLIVPDNKVIPPLRWNKSSILQ